MDRQLEKIIKLVSRTGEKVVILKDDQEFLLTNLDDYLGLVGEREPIEDLSGRELLDKINRDIALWRESQRELLNRADDQPTQELMDEAEDLFSPGDYSPRDFQAQEKIDQITDNFWARENEVDNIFSSRRPAWVDTPFSSSATEEPFNDDEDFDNLFADNKTEEEKELNYQDSAEDKEDEQAENFNSTSMIEEALGSGTKFADFPEKEIKLDPDLKPVDLPTVDAGDYDFEDEFKKSEPLWAIEDLPHKEKKSSVKKPEKDSASFTKKINNFGYANPTDTLNNRKKEPILEKYNKNFNEFGHIPPPPDIARN